MPRRTAMLEPIVIAGGMAVAAAAMAVAQQPASPPPDKGALDRLFEERGDAAAFERAAAAARKQRVPDQVLLEARFLYHVDRHEDAALAALAPQFLAARDTFEPDASAVFAVREDWLAVVEYVQALAALERADRAAFKRHITEAFWLSPRQAAAYAPLIERLQMQQAMRTVKVDLDTMLQPLGGGEEVALARLLADRRALVLHLWSPWSRECEELAADFAAAARELDRHAVAVVSLLAADDPQLLDHARKFVATHGADVPAHWLRDRKQQPLHAMLRARTLPVMVVVARDGSIRFNGHPTDPGCWNAVRELVPAFQRPQRTDEPTAP